MTSYIKTFWLKKQSTDVLCLYKRDASGKINNQKNKPQSKMNVKTVKQKLKTALIAIQAMQALGFANEV